MSGEEQISLLATYICQNVDKIKHIEYKDGVINVQGDVSFTKKEITQIPVQFGYIDGNLGLGGNHLTSLKGCPHEITGDFYCWNNQLTSLEFAPIKIGGSVKFNDNPFILSNKLFEDLRRYRQNKMPWHTELMNDLYDQIPIQFGITDEIIINEIWRSYMKIYDEAI